ncbi:hypothetical protein CALVIDRAFT_552946 [Calocera viscosa TUFC12733]|uniref:S-adenosyl-L-methionine-dependent methyltransferase n=1 Tax=Calocera viscosa (strain TUFC12733) TaxID=1330018 RepID=A0A167QPD4_CALVF|nr:hypothetical protein CALVIDRAFT_552946 [Calocera viscosa TUFC12733]
MENERYYASQTYLLPADEVEQTRLQLQHEMLKEKLSGQLLPAGFIVKDGVWAVDVSNGLPKTASIVGTDICDRLFTAATPKVTFEVQSTLTLPAAWSSTFALAHQRLLILAFSSSAWQQAISELYRVLQPGGWVQIEEKDVLRVTWSDQGPVPPLTAKFLNVLCSVCREREVGPESLLLLPEFMKAAGFEDLKVSSVRIYTGGEEGKEVRKAWIGAWRAMQGPMLKGGGAGLAKTPLEYSGLMDCLEEEWVREPFEWKFITWTARKPM